MAARPQLRGPGPIVWLPRLPGTYSCVESCRVSCRVSCCVASCQSRLGLQRLVRMGTGAVHGRDSAKGQSALALSGHDGVGERNRTSHSGHRSHGAESTVTQGSFARCAHHACVALHFALSGVCAGCECETNSS
jgi:hypothetical protein